jgi:uncharacterized membrane protein
VATPRDLDRLVFFTDAVVAIAVTLLVLPLVDVVPGTAARGDRAVEVITGHGPELFSFALSFAVIIRLWMVHHRIFRHVRAYSTPLMLCDIGWLFTIVVLPFPKEMVGVYGTDRFTVGFYIGTIVLASVFQTALNLVIRADPEVESETDPLAPEYMVASVTATALLALAWVLSVTVPGLSYWTLCLLFLSSLVERTWLRRQPFSRSSR